MSENYQTSDQELENSDDVKELISKLITHSSAREGVEQSTCENEETSVTQFTPEMEAQVKRDRKLTERGLEYKLEIATKTRNAAHSKLTKQVKRIYSLLHEGIDQHSLEIERETLDSIKENFNNAHEALWSLSPEDDRESLYRYFDLRDREYLECRTRICERLHEQERRSQGAKSVKSYKSRSSSRSSHCSRQSALVKQLEAETKAAKLEIELQFLELDTEMRKLQLQKEAALAKVEASTARRFLNQIKEEDDKYGMGDPYPHHTEEIKVSPQGSKTSEEQTSRDIKSRGDTRDDLCHTKEDKHLPLYDLKKKIDPPPRESSSPCDKKERTGAKEDSLSPRDTKQHEYLPLRDIKDEDDELSLNVKKEIDDRRRPSAEETEPRSKVPPTSNPWFSSSRLSPRDQTAYTNYEPAGIIGSHGFASRESTFRELIMLQQRQTELSAMIVNQQKRSALPVQEPPVFDGDFLDYPIFKQAFEAIIEDKVDTDNDRLYFLNKFTSGKANDVVKGFVTLNSPDGYQQAKKILAQRFGNPHHVAEAYKSKLRKWPSIKDDDESTLQDFSDFLVRCKEAMETLQYMDELNSTETLIAVSAKLPSYAGVKWCRHARELQNRSGRVVFKDLVRFVREEAEMANDPIFSPNVLKKERNKGLPRESLNTRPSQRRSLGVNALLTSSAINSEPRTAKPVSQCPLCKESHGLEDCKKYLEQEVKQHVEFIRSNGLCFGCLRKGHLSKTCRTRLKCKECSKYHPTSIHNPDIKKEESNESPSEQPVDDAHSRCTNTRESVTNSMILPVWLHQKRPPRERSDGVRSARQCQ